MRTLFKRPSSGPRTAVLAALWLAAPSLLGVGCPIYADDEGDCLTYGWADALPMGLGTAGRAIRTTVSGLPSAIEACPAGFVCSEVTGRVAFRATSVTVYEWPCDEMPSRTCLRSAANALGPSVELMLPGSPERGFTYDEQGCSWPETVVPFDDLGVPATATIQQTANANTFVAITVSTHTYPGPTDGPYQYAVEAQKDEVFWLAPLSEVEEYVPVEGDTTDGDVPNYERVTYPQFDETTGYAVLRQDEFVDWLKLRIARVEGRGVEDPCETTTLCDLAPATPSNGGQTDAAK